MFGFLRWKLKRIIQRRRCCESGADDPVIASIRATQRSITYDITLNFICATFDAVVEVEWIFGQRAWG